MLIFIFICSVLLQSSCVSSAEGSVAASGIAELEAKAIGSVVQLLQSEGRSESKSIVFVPDGIVIAVRNELSSRVSKPYIEPLSTHDGSLGRGSSSAIKAEVLELSANHSYIRVSVTTGDLATVSWLVTLKRENSEWRITNIEEDPIVS
jgi:hypothetical protein